MRFIITPSDLEWSVALFDDPQTLLMRAEILTLNDVALHEGRLCGVIQAAWGVTLLDDTAAGSPHFLKALGIGRSFKGRPATIPLIVEDGTFFCGETNKPLSHVYKVLLTRRKMHYIPNYREESNAVDY